jgi:hypothetical protein
MQAPIFQHKNEHYYESQITTTHQLFAAASLSGLNECPPHSPEAIQKFLFHSDHSFVTEAWLLWTMDKPVLGTSEGGTKVHRAKYASQQYQTFLMFSTLPSAPDSGGQPVTVVNSFCRDPWADTELVACWADMRLLKAAESLYGYSGASGAVFSGTAKEVRWYVMELDTPLQRALKLLGWTCREFEPDSLPPCPVRKIGILQFVKPIVLKPVPKPLEKFGKTFESKYFHHGSWGPW